MVHKSGIGFPDGIAENEALRENLFMMVSYIEPLKQDKIKNKKRKQ